MRRAFLPELFLSAMLSLLVTTQSSVKAFSGGAAEATPDYSRLKRAFTQALQPYKQLQNLRINLVIKPLQASTMRAVPVLTWRSLFSGIKHYEVQVSPLVKSSEALAIHALPHQVLVGWFAHELGHIADYQGRSATEMLWYGIKYTCNRSFRKRCEYQADLIAIAHGFTEAIITTKQFLASPNLSAAYRAQLKLYYMSIEDVKLCSTADADSLKIKLDTSIGE